LKREYFTPEDKFVVNYSSTCYFTNFVGSNVARADLSSVTRDYIFGEPSVIVTM